MTVQYIDNDEMMKEYKVWRSKYLANKEQGLPRPDIPKYLAECILLICDKLGNRYNFNGYSFRSEMTSDAIEDCVRYFHSFDPDKSNYIFAYFTKIAFHAFTRRIHRERKQMYIKGKMIQQLDPTEFFEGMGDESLGGVIDQHRAEFNIDTEPYEKYLDKKRKKRENTLENFEELSD